MTTRSEPASMNPIHHAMFVHLHARATAAADEIKNGTGWCCSIHETLIRALLGEHMDEFRALAPEDDGGLMQCMDEISMLVDNLEMLACLRHPGVNVMDVGEA